jgi:hypothetical protein
VVGEVSVIKGFTSELVRTSGGLLEPCIKTGAKLLQREEEVRVRADGRAGQGLDGIDQSFELQALEVPKHAEGRIANSWKKHGSIDVMSRNDIDDACNFFATRIEKRTSRLEIVGDGRFQFTRVTARADHQRACRIGNWKLTKRRGSGKVPNLAKINPRWVQGVVEGAQGRDSWVDHDLKNGLALTGLLGVPMLDYKKDASDRTGTKRGETCQGTLTGRFSRWV